jgi:hypothetical protein
LENDFLFLLKGFAIVILCIVVVQYILDGDDEKVTNIYPISISLPVCRDFLQNISELVLELLLSGFGIAFE